MSDEDGDRERPERRVPRADPATLGLRAIDAPEGGARVEAIDPASPAADELKPGDVVLEVNGTAVRSARDLTGKFAGLSRPGAAFFRVRRGLNFLYVGVDLDNR
jgi:S1-C subfamily serine protease